MLESIKQYIKDSYNELMTKVSWPTWEDLRASAAVVLIAAVIIAFVIGVMDGVSNLLFQEVIYKITG
ncbi:MAG: preprotein translocase subunit SecE [Chitinophagales bacterium]|nr:preprotein translocase subunit SecE [Chitinophagales bacterium]